MTDETFSSPARKVSASRRTPRRRNRRARWGTTTVEVAIVAPIFFLFIFSCMEFTRLSAIRNLTNNAAYEAARHTIVAGASAQEATDRAVEMMETLGASGVTVQVSSEDEDGNVSSGLPEDASSVIVRVEVPYASNLMVFPGSLFGDLKMISEISLRTSRYNAISDDD